MAHENASNRAALRDRPGYESLAPSNASRRPPTQLVVIVFLYATFMLDMPNNLAHQCL